MGRIQVRPYKAVNRRGTIVHVGNEPYIAVRDTATQPPGDDWKPPIIRNSAWNESGPPGPPGESIKGDKGDPGPPGESIKGDRGESIVWAGDWRRGRAYQKNQSVSHDGSSWISLVDDNRAEPTETSRKWSLMAAKGEQGERGENGIGQRGRPGADGQTIVIENGNPPVAAIFDSNTARGDVLYVAETGHVDLAIASGEPQTLAVGIALASVSAGMAGTYQTTGAVSNPAWNLVPGTVYYLDGSVPGGMTSIYPTTVGHFVVILGAALSETELNLNIHWANYIAA